jgi:hypothetical protein
MGLYEDISKVAWTRTPEIKCAWIAENSMARSDTERLQVALYNPRSKVGSILWRIVSSHLDVMHSIKASAQFLTDPGDAVVEGLQCIGCYLLGIAPEGQRLYRYTGDVALRIPLDADDANGPHRRSMLCCVSWIGPPLSGATGFARRAFFQWTSHWSIAVPCRSIYAIHAATKGSASTRGLLGPARSAYTTAWPQASKSTAPPA